jgi:arabinan endo-1,5-alpha-L-arabinosidase
MFTVADPMPGPLLDTAVVRDAKTVAELFRVSGSAFPFDEVRTGDLRVHDPSVTWFRGTYVMVATSGDSFSPISISSDMLHWSKSEPIFAEPPAWLQQAVPMHRSIWAPAPVVVGNTLRIYYCSSQKFGSNTSFIGMAENDRFDPKTPTKGWVDRGMLLESHAGKDNFNAIDPDVLIAPDGRHWMVYGSYWDGMYQVELDPTSGLVKPGAKPFHVASNPTERGNPLEAPALRYHDGYYYLYVVYGLAAQGVRSTYRMMVGRSRQPDGPFTGFTGAPMTEGGHTDVLKSSPPMFAPGGGNVFQDAFGQDWLAYHYYDSRLHWHGDVWGRPTFQIRRQVWGQDGWPLPGLPAGISLIADSSGLVGHWLIQSDFGAPVEVELRADGTVHGHHEGIWHQERSLLSLELGEHQLKGLVVDSSGKYFVGRNMLGAIVRGINLDAKVRPL